MVATRKRPRRNPNAKAKPKMTKAVRDTILKSETEEKLNVEVKPEVKKNPKPRKSAEHIDDVDKGITDTDFIQNWKNPKKILKTNLKMLKKAKKRKIIL